MSSCPDPAELERYHDGALDADAAERVRRHLLGCTDCRDAASSTETILRKPLGPNDYPSGYRIGPFVIRGLLGEGTFGRVYLAERHTEFRQRVALKVMKAGMDTDRLLARFAAERQALALMNHPNIAKVLDSGRTPDGRPFFAMEHVPGIPITEHCDRHRLGIEERLRLFQRVCDAVQHAHQKGVVHRDIKPSNVLVAFEDGAATPKLIDFGVAKALNQPLSEETLFTQDGQMIGTPAYMSPEQADRTVQDIDTRSDIYSLGVLLYEMLTGTLPFDRETFKNAAIDRVRQIICEVDPPKPSTRLATLASTASAGTAAAGQVRRVDPRTLIRTVRGDLDWITMKCLEKERSRRYGSASDLAADIENHLSQRPVDAGPPSASYRARKFIRRHRGGILATAAIVTVALTGLLTATALWVEQREASRELRRREAVDLAEQAGLLAAYKRPEQARRQVELALEKDPECAAALVERARQHRRDGRVDQAVADAENALRLDPEAGSAAAVLAGVLERRDPALAREYRAKAERLLKSYQLHYELAVNEDDPAAALQHLGASLADNPWYFEALWQRAVLRFDKKQYDEALQDAELLTKVRRDQALTWILKGAALIELQRYTEAVAALDRAIEIDGESWMAHFNRGLAYSRDGNYYEGDSRPDAEHDRLKKLALEEFERAAELNVAGLAPGETVDERPLLEIAESHLYFGEYERAIAAFDRMIAAGHDDWRARSGRGSAKSYTGDHQGGEDDLSVALDHWPSDPAHAETRLETLYDRARARVYLGRFEPARSDLRLILEALPEEPGTITLWGLSLVLEGRYAEAVPYYTRSLAIDPQNAFRHLERGLAGWMADDLDLALEGLRAYFDSEEPDAPAAGLWIWDIESSRGRTQAATEVLDRAAARSTSRLIPSLVDAARGGTGSEVVLAAAQAKEDRVRALYHLGAIAERQGRIDDARVWFERCVELGLVGHWEHRLAQWRLRRMTGHPPGGAQGTAGVVDPD